MSINDSLDDLFNEFYSIKNAEGRAEKTLRQYVDNYSFFTEYLDAKKIERRLSNINRKVIRDYIVYMRGEHVKFEDHKYITDEYKTVGLAPSTINTRLKTLRVMFGCLFDEGIISSNPINGVKNVPEHEEVIEVLDEKELSRIINAPDRRSYAGYRDYTMLHMLTDGMMRIGELTRLKVQNFDFSGKTVTIPARIAKSRRTRRIPLSPVTLRLVSDLIRNNEEFNTDYVFLTNYGEPISGDHFRKRLNIYAEKVGIKKNVYPHLLRHTAATLYLENGGETSHLRLLLGHADLRMIQRYVHLSDMSLKRQHAKYTPINKVTMKLRRPRKTKIDL